MTSLVYIGAGSNMGDRVSYLHHALQAIHEDPGMAVTGCSSIYETDPYGPVKQADFLNLVAELTTDYPPDKLLKQLQGIEASLNRIRTVHWGPRTIDLDILLYNDESIEMEYLKVPHPEMSKRAFVMVPLSELAPAVSIPGTGSSAYELSLRFKKDKSVRLWKRAMGDMEFGLF